MIFFLHTGNFTSSDLLLKWENESAISISKETPFLAEYQLDNAVHQTDYNKFTETDTVYDEGM